MFYRRLLVVISDLMFREGFGDLWTVGAGRSIYRRFSMAKRHKRGGLSRILWLIVCAGVVSGADYVPADKILLNCGASGKTTDTDGREWTSDIGSKFVLTVADSTTSVALNQDPSVQQVPFMTARVLHSDFTYSFQVSSGRHFVRLYFYPCTYNDLNVSSAIFGVTTGTYTLLRNFSVQQTTEALNYAYLVKEYSINVIGETLNLTFTPSKNYAYSFAFVNGIEIVSMPDIYSTETMIVGQNSPFYIDNTTALENVYRLNVGGNDISPSHDTGMYRSWYDDSPYLFGAAIGVADVADPNVTISYQDLPAYVAPSDVYSTARSMGPNASVNVNYNLTWIFSIDKGFSYLIRLHFCEVSDVITKINQRMFSIYLGNLTAAKEADVAGWTGGNLIPVYKNYVVFVPIESPQQDLWLALHPYTAQKSEYYDVILNGIEIFKVNDATGNLAGVNPIPAPTQPIADPSLVTKQGYGKPPKRAAIIARGVGGVGALAVVISFLVVLSYHGRKYRKESRGSIGPYGWLSLSLHWNSHSAGSVKTNTTGSYTSYLPSNLCRHFSFADIKSVTRNFDDSLLLGVGGFGKVYKGEIDGGGTHVAIKRGNPLSEQGAHEFQTEIEMLSKLRHRHLVSLIGYCEENCEMILVYDYMAHGTLREHLYKTQNTPLKWKQRLEICIGAARGLHYLHTGAKQTIIHRDVKTTNILLDDKWVAKVSDFGLSKTGPALDHTHVSTVVKGSFGYLDPEYFRRQQLTDKSDVYSFGVVLFEILCARPALNPNLPKEQVSLAEWASHCHKKGILGQILDPFLKGKIAPECFENFAETAIKCVSDQGIDRPSMGDVLWNLEFALQLQESAEKRGKGFGGSDMEDGAYDLAVKDKIDPSTSPGINTTSTDTRTRGMSISRRSLASEDSDGLTSSAVFSQIMNPKGR